MRTQLMIEHFGARYEEIKDPIQCREWLNKRTETNSQLYQEIFRCEPDDSIRTYKELQERRKIRSDEQHPDNYAVFKAKYEELKGGIKGHAVVYPTQFLAGEKSGLEFP